MTTEQPNTIQKPKTQGPQRANSRGLIQAYQFREIAADHAMQLKDEPAGSLADKSTRAKALQSLAQVWEVASDRIRILRGKPLPGSLRPERKPTKKKPTRAIPQEQPDSPATAAPEEQGR